jgi:hypothetical protein
MGDLVSFNSETGPDSPPAQGIHLVNSAVLSEIEKRIQVIEDNLSQLQEQAAAYSGAADEELMLIASRIRSRNLPHF